MTMSSISMACDARVAPKQTTGVPDAFGEIDICTAHGAPSPRRPTGVIFDQTLVLQGYQSARDYPETFRGIRNKDPETGKRLLFISNNTVLPALTICSLYKARWQVELFFRWIKMHLRVKAFFGTSENAVKSQIWIAVSVYVLVAIIRKRLNRTRSLYEMLQILSLNLFEKTPLDTALSGIPLASESAQSDNQLILL
jgi:Transposase DDE domain